MAPTMRAQIRSTAQVAAGARKRLAMRMEGAQVRIDLGPVRCRSLGVGSLGN